MAGEADAPASALLGAGQSCRAIAGSPNDLVRPDQQRPPGSSFLLTGRTSIDRYEALALRFQGLSPLTFEGCLHSVV